MVIFGLFLKMYMGFHFVVSTCPCVTKPIFWFFHGVLHQSQGNLGQFSHKNRGSQEWQRVGVVPIHPTEASYQNRLKKIKPYSPSHALLAVRQ